MKIEAERERVIRKTKFQTLFICLLIRIKDLFSLDQVIYVLHILKLIHKFWLAFPYLRNFSHQNRLREFLLKSATFCDSFNFVLNHLSDSKGYLNHPLYLKSSAPSWKSFLPEENILKDHFRFKSSAGSFHRKQVPHTYSHQAVTQIFFLVRIFFRIDFLIK